MKAKLIIGLIFLSNVLLAQKDEKKVVFFGFDFSKAKLIGSGEFNNPQSIRDNNFPAWNKYFDDQREDGECSVTKNYKKETVVYDYKIVTQRNKDINYKNLVIDDQEYSLSDGAITSTIKQYDSDQKGLGLVIIVESLNKPKHLVTMYAVFFDIPTKKVKLVKCLKGKASGMFGFSYYWLSGLGRAFRSFKY